MTPVKKLVLKEFVPGDGYWRYWYDEVPLRGDYYRVLEDSWQDRHTAAPIRHIYSWERAGGEEGEEGPRS